MSIPSMGSPFHYKNTAFPKGAAVRLGSSPNNLAGYRELKAGETINLDDALFRLAGRIPEITIGNRPGQDDLVFENVGSKPIWGTIQKRGSSLNIQSQEPTNKIIVNNARRYDLVLSKDAIIQLSEATNSPKLSVNQNGDLVVESGRIYLKESSFKSNRSAAASPPIVKSAAAKADPSGKTSLQPGMTIYWNSVFGNNKIITLGKSPDNTIVCPENTTISRKHAEFRQVADKLYVMDHSSNGTYVNGQEIESGVDVPLRLNDIIEFDTPGSGPKFKVGNNFELIFVSTGQAKKDVLTKSELLEKPTIEAKRRIYIQL